MDMKRDHITYRIGKHVIEGFVVEMLWDPKDVETFTFKNDEHYHS